jgi:hypothetical protein
MYECRCYERLKTKDEESTLLTYTGSGTPKDKDDVNRRDVCECDGSVCVLEGIGTPSRLRCTQPATLTRVLPTLRTPTNPKIILMLFWIHGAGSIRWRRYIFITLTSSWYLISKRHNNFINSLSPTVRHTKPSWLVHTGPSCSLARTLTCRSYVD